ncbi:hypothetical protein DIE15_08215 [Burkholderia sp. Bp9031]|uniref:hypothetical protein n=1 Tax=Burkholderia sp. Bp9031 TaxID=2184566 RepID=UPI000F5D86CD|nr:hypothetical protein [Burkholderia sp. Bp9031]RQZ18108.1 hypothetical protein DIE15_08215 [Burkholderia sp. Bp9031]
MTKRRPTPDQILARMSAGTKYEASTVASKFGIKATQMKPLLEALVESGRLTRGARRHGERLCPAYVRPTNADIALRESTSVAGPAYAPDWRSTLTGYDSAHRERAELCMMARTQ